MTTTAFPGHVFDELESLVDERTLEILEHRRKGAVIKRRGWLVRRVLLVADLLGLVVALGLAEWLVNRHNNVGVIDVQSEISVFLASLPLWVVVAKLYGLYDRDEERTDHSTVDDFTGVFHMVTVTTFVFWVFCYLTGLAHPNGPKLIIFWAAAIGFITVGRVTGRTIARRSIVYLQNTLIVGAGDVGQLIARKLLQHPEYGLNLVGFVDCEPKSRREDLGHLALLGGTEKLASLVQAFDIERVIIAFSRESHEETLAVIRLLRQFDVQIDLVPRLFEIVGPSIDIHTVEGLPLVGLAPARISRSSKFLKRALDVTLSLGGLILLAPLFVLIGIVVKLDSPGPIFFRQVRMGSNDQTFRILKFRSMVVDADVAKRDVAHLNKHLRRGGDPRMFKIPNDPRVTRTGKWLRRHSLDELPQLLNVLRGEMSLVGARPLILDEDRYVEDWARRRLDLKPGLTGPWQVAGRDSIPFEEMTRLDYLYVTNWSLVADLQLIAKTVPMLLRSGI